MPTLITPPTLEPVSLAEAKTQLRLEDDNDDAQILLLITAARQYAEQICWRSFLPTAWQVTLGGFRGEDRLQLTPHRGDFGLMLAGYEWANSDRAYRFAPYLELPLGQLIATTPVSAFTYIDPNGATQTLDPSVYEVDGFSVPGRIHLAYQQSWPQTRNTWNAVTIRYSTGWADAKSVPAPLRQAILLHTAQLYEYRTPEVITRAVPVPVSLSYDSLISPYRLNRY